MRHVVPAVATLLAAAAFAAPALAHEGDPRYDSVLTGEPPRGIDVQVLNYGDRLSLRNETSETVVVEGYEEEPYARLLPDGTVQVNTRSPAAYLNDDPYADAPVPDSADPEAEPVWRTVEGDGRFEFHDHRIHWMTPDAIPPAVEDESQRTKVFDWAVPLTVGPERTAITGTLWWRGGEGGMPVGAIAGFGGFLLASVLLVAAVRRRRRRAEPAEAW
jgi:hypothetical protein